MKILAIGSTYDLPELHIFAGLAKCGYQIEAIVSSDSPHTSRLEASGIRCHVLDFKSRLDFRAVGKLRGLLKRGQFEVFHCLTARGLSNLLIAAMGIPGHVIAYRGTSGRDSRWSPASWLSFLNPRVEKIICVSNAVRSFMSGVVAERKLVTIYKGHDVSWYQPQADLNLGMFGVPADAFVVSCVANLRPVKGVVFLLEALKLLVEKGNDDVHVVLVGELRGEASLPHLRDPALVSRIHAVGFQSNVATFVARSNAFVLPSIAREGLPKAMLEAMSLGTPVIVTEVGGMPEVVKHGQNGIVVPPCSASALAAAIESLHGDPDLAGKLGAAGRRTIQEVYTVERAVRETAAVYASLEK